MLRTHIQSLLYKTQHKTQHEIQPAPTEDTAKTVVIRNWRREDVETLPHIANNRKIWRNLTHMFPHPYTKEEAEQWISLASLPESPTKSENDEQMGQQDNQQDNQQDEQTLGESNWAVTVDGKLAGAVGIIRRQGIYEKTAGFGYWFGEEYWGQGVASHVVHTVLPYIWHTFPNIARLEAEVFAWNPASARVLEKAGFMREAYMHKRIYKDGQLVDGLMYVMLREGLELRV